MALKDLPSLNETLPISKAWSHAWKLPHLKDMLRNILAN